MCVQEELVSSWLVNSYSVGGKQRRLLSIFMLVWKHFHFSPPIS